MSVPILLLEDEPVIRDLLEAVLADEGHAVRACASRDQLMVAARDVPGALALVDFWGTSYQALGDDEREEVLALARTVPTILVSGRAWVGRECADELGLLALVPKPFDVDDLVDLVAECSARLEPGRASTTAG